MKATSAAPGKILLLHTLQAIGRSHLGWKVIFLKVIIILKGKKTAIFKAK